MHPGAVFKEKSAPPCTGAGSLRHQARIAERGQHQRLDGVLAVLRLVPHPGRRPLDHLHGDLVALHRGQAVQEDRVRLPVSFISPAVTW